MGYYRGRWGGRGRSRGWGGWEYRPKVDRSKFTKGRDDLKPVVVEGRTIARSFWGKSWCGHFETMADWENRLPRGRTYVRTGAILDLRVTAGAIKAVVAGSDFYDIDVKIDRLPEDRWRALVKASHGSIATLADLMRGKFSDEIMTMVCHPLKGMFPTRKEISWTCSCPDSAHLCKHVASVFYGVGHRLDLEPGLIFTLRQVEPAELLAGSADELLSGTRDDALSGDLSAIFGVEVDTWEAPLPAGRPAPAPAAAAPRTRRTAKVRPAPEPVPEPPKAKRGRKPKPKPEPMVLPASPVLAEPRVDLAFPVQPAASAQSAAPVPTAAVLAASPAPPAARSRGLAGFGQVRPAANPAEARPAAAAKAEAAAKPAAPLQPAAAAEAGAAAAPTGDAGRSKLELLIRSLFQSAISDARQPGRPRRKGAGPEPAGAEPAASSEPAPVAAASAWSAPVAAPGAGPAPVSAASAWPAPKAAPVAAAGVVPAPKAAPGAWHAPKAEPVAAASVGSAPKAASGAGPAPKAAPAVVAGPGPAPKAAAPDPPEAPNRRRVPEAAAPPSTAAWCPNLSSIKGRDVRALRRMAGLSIEDLAQALGVTASSIRRWESIDGHLGLHQRTAEGLKVFGEYVMSRQRRQTRRRPSQTRGA